MLTSTNFWSSGYERNGIWFATWTLLDATSTKVSDHFAKVVWCCHCCHFLNVFEHYPRTCLLTAANVDVCILFYALNVFDGQFIGAFRQGVFILCLVSQIHYAV